MVGQGPHDRRAQFAQDRPDLECDIGCGGPLSLPLSQYDISHPDPRPVPHCVLQVENYRIETVLARSLLVSTISFKLTIYYLACKDIIEPLYPSVNITLICNTDIRPHQIDWIMG